MNKKKNITTKETFTLAVQNHQKNNLQVAEKLYKETLKTNPNHIETIFLLGSLSAQTNNEDKAKKYFLYEQNQTIIKPPDNCSCRQYTGSKGFFCKNYYN